MSVAAYVDPLELAKVTAERIDQGVDYAGSGELVSLGPAKVICVALGAGASGWPGTGNFVEYQLTGGAEAGQDVYYAEGVDPTVSEGQTLAAGQEVATIVPDSPTGIELGYGSGIGTSTYAASHGGYSEGSPTASGVAFSNLIASLGGPAGVQPAAGASIMGSAPGSAPASSSSSSSSSGGSGILGSGIGPNVGPDLNPVDAIDSAFNSALSWLESNLLKGALYGALIIGGVILAGYGLTRTFSSRPGAGARVAPIPVEA